MKRKVDFNTPHKIWCAEYKKWCKEKGLRPCKDVSLTLYMQYLSENK